MSLQELIEKFLSKTGYLEDEKVCAIVFYGSRIRGTNKDSSDLDVLVISKQRKNMKAAMLIDGIKIDYNIFSVYDLFDIAYEKRVINNAYFESVLKNGLVIKNNGILEELREYLDSLEGINNHKKKVSNQVLDEIKELYDNFVTAKQSYWYYNLLEKLRMTYNYLNNCSYISMVKVYDVFSNGDFYEDAYSISLPSLSFRSLFIEAVTTTEFDLQLNVINRIIEILGMNLNKNRDYYEEEELFLTDNDIKNELIIIYNKVEKMIDLLTNNHPYADYSYNVLLRQIDLFYQRVYRNNSTEINDAIKNANKISNEERVKILRELFGIVDKDYRFDYDNYMIKLKL